MTAKIVAVFNQKGGCAKTMSSMQLAGTFGIRGLKVFVVDMDPQNTAALWGLQATPEQPFPADVMSFAPMRAAFVNKLEALVEKYDVIIIDCPPAIESPVPWTALLVADLAIIPVVPVMDNVWASKQAEELVLKAREDRQVNGVAGELKAAYLLSMYRKGKVFDVCLAALKKGIRLPILNATVGMRNAFPESQLFGCVVGSFGKSTAAGEIDTAATEILKLLELKIPKKQESKL